MCDVTLICMLQKFLDTDDLNEAGREIPTFIGTYAADILPKNIKKNCCWIWNTDDSSKPGQHWVAFFKQNNKIFFFDSFAKNVKFYKNEQWKTIIEQKLKCTFIQYINKPIQSPISFTCGAWSLLFLYEMTFFNKFNKKIYSNIKMDNEKKLKTKINLYFGNTIKKIYKRKCKEACNGRQVCCNYITLLKNKR